MTLGDKQKLFARLVPRLLDKLHELGLEATLGDAYRDPRVHGPVGTKLGYGHPKSAHKQRLAIDINIFKDGVYQTTEAWYKELGEWWEKQHDLARWGGRFQDPNHFSLEHEGIR